MLDRLVGFELSPLLWKKVRPQLSAGRVQSVAVRLLVEREREIIAFRSTPYYRVVAQFYAAADPDKTLFKAELSTRFDTREEAETFLRSCIDARFTVAKAEEKPAQRYPRLRSRPRRSSRRRAANSECRYRRRCPWRSTSTSRV